jgi:hypothetical protein
MATPEGYVKRKVSGIFKALKRVWYYMPVPSGFGQPNLDYNACAPCVSCGRGLFIVVETKAPGKKPTAQQEATIERLRKAGAAVFVIDGNTEELELWLQQNVQQ